MLQLVLLLSLFGADPDERLLIDYFLTHRTSTGLVLDGTHDRQTVSVAATGFGMDVWAIAAHKGYISRQQALDYIHQALDETMRQNQGNRGWLYHFTDPHGNPRFDGEVSSIDSAIFYLGARQAALRLADAKLLEKVNALIAAVDIGWMLENGYDPKFKGKKYFSHGFYWEVTGTTTNGEVIRKPRFIKYDWKEYSEGVLLYRLFNLQYDIDAIDPALPLFTFYYPLCFFGDPEYVERLRKCVSYQAEHFGFVGKTACMGPNGYGIMEEHIISPVAIWACTKLIQETSDALAKLNVQKYAPWHHVKTGQTGTGMLAIDVGSCVILLNKDLGMASTRSTPLNRPSAQLSLAAD